MTLQTLPVRPVGVPAHLPARLTICLWDFSWYTQAAPGEAFADLDRAMAETVERGYNTVRICAAPLLLFGDLGLDTTQLPFAAMGGGVGHGTRWYNCAGGAIINGRSRLLDLFEAARRWDVHVIVSSWEYQQSSAFLADSRWYDALMAIEPGRRYQALADALVAMVGFLAEHGLADRIAYLELHNEVDLSRLTEIGGPGADPYWCQRDVLTQALRSASDRLPDYLVTACYGVTPHLDMGCLPDNVHVAHCHVYVYGVLGALEQWAGVRLGPPQFPTDNLVGLLSAHAPAFDSQLAQVPRWRLDATGVSPSMFYAYDNVDPELWDRWLYDNYHRYAEAMDQAVRDRLTAISLWARRHGVPAVVGEGWVGYTPLHADFEDGPIGHAINERAVQLAAEMGFWGAVLGSNCAPHHPAWADADWQKRWNRYFLSTGTPDRPRG